MGGPIPIKEAWDEWQRIRDPLQNTQNMVVLGFGRVEEAYEAALRALSEADSSLSQWHYVLHHMMLEGFISAYGLAAASWLGWDWYLEEREGDSPTDRWTASEKWWWYSSTEPLWRDMDPQTRRTWDRWALNRTLHVFFETFVKKEEEEEELVSNAKHTHPPVDALYTAANDLQDRLGLLDTALDHFES